MVSAMFKRAKAVTPAAFQSSRAGMYFLLAGLAIVIVPHFEHLPLWTILTCFSLLLWRLLADLQRLPLPNKYVTFLIFMMITLGVASSYLTIVGREAGTALLISLVCLKLFEIKSLRDISLIVQLAFFAIVVTFLFSQSIFVALMMLVDVTLFTTALISFQHAKSGQMQRVVSEKAHFKLALKMLVYAIPLALVIFILFPRTSTPLWGLPSDAFAAKTGLSDDMSPGDISHLVDSPAVAFRVQFQSTIPQPAKTYWRGPVFWAFDGRTWSAPVPQRRAMKKISLRQAANPIMYSLTLEPHNNIWLFALDLPGTIPESSVVSTEMQIVATKSVTHVMRYEMTSYLDYVLPNIAWLPTERYLYVPQDSAPRARQFIQTLMQQYPEKASLVQAVLQHFSNQQYFYSRHPPLLFGDPTDEFLFETKRGYCEHYASSFTVLMRLAGIPARVVTGYLGGEMNPLSNYMIVRQSNAHAWSEIYLEGKGWLRVDPTAVVPLSNIENATDADRFRNDTFTTRDISDRNWYAISVKRLQYTWDMMNYRWSQWVIGYSNEKQKTLFKAIGVPEITWRGLSYLLFATLSILILLIAANIFRAQRFQKRGHEKIYAQFLRKLRPLNLEKSASEGALGFSLRAAQALPNQSVELVNIANLYNQIRYADAGPVTTEALRRAVQAVHFKAKK